MDRAPPDPHETVPRKALTHGHEESERAEAPAHHPEPRVVAAALAWAASFQIRPLPNRADLIKALGLESEGRTRGDKYAATTKEFYATIVRGESLAARRARRKLGLGT